MITHMCTKTGWTVEYILSMPARRFYAMRLEMIKQDQKERANFYYDLCDVAAIPLCNSEYYKEVKEYFRMSSLDIEERNRIHRMNSHIFDADDAIDSKRAAMALRAMLGGNSVVMNG